MYFFSSRFPSSKVFSSFELFLNWVIHRCSSVTSGESYVLVCCRWIPSSFMASSLMCNKKWFYFSKIQLLTMGQKYWWWQNADMFCYLFPSTGMRHSWFFDAGLRLELFETIHGLNTLRKPTSETCGSVSSRNHLRRTRLAFSYLVSVRLHPHASCPSWFWLMRF